MAVAGTEADGAEVVAVFCGDFFLCRFAAGAAAAAVAVFVDAYCARMTADGAAHARRHVRARAIVAGNMGVESA